MATTKDLKSKRAEAKITRGQLAKTAGISQFALDKHERGVAVSAEIVKAYDAALSKLIAEAAKAPKAQPKKTAAKPAAKKTAAKAPAKKAAPRARKQPAQPKPEPKAEAEKAVA